MEQVHGWDEDEQRHVHEGRFQTQDYRVISVADTDVGIMAVVVSPDCLQLNQLFLLPQHQGKGIGRRCMSLILEEARQLGLPVRLRVLKVNPRALAFYQRLGFTRAGDTATHDLLERVREARMQLKYGMNPHQRFAAAEPVDSGEAPVQVLSGKPSLINFLDALNGWQLVRELRTALGVPAAASFKHVSPAGVAVWVARDEQPGRSDDVDAVSLSPLALAYVRARGADPKSAFGDFVALSDPVDEATAIFLNSVVSDGIIAPGYEPKALGILAAKKSGAFIICQVDPAYCPPLRETREVFGMRLVQDRNHHAIGLSDLNDVRCGALTGEAARDLILGLITLKYTQSNSVAYAQHGQVIGIGAGQQSRVDCTKLAGAKADVWQLGRHPKVLGLTFKKGVKRQDRINWRIRYIEGSLAPWEFEAMHAALERPAEPLTASDKREFLAAVDQVSFVSDGFIPFRDNIDRAAEHGVRYIAQPGGASRDEEVEAACRDYGIAMVHTHVRLFHH